MWHSFWHNKTPHFLDSISYCLTNGVQFKEVRNIIDAIIDLVTNPKAELFRHCASVNRASSMGDALEEYVKDLFAGTVEETDENIRNQRVFGYKEVYFSIWRYSPVQGLCRLFLFIGFFSFCLRVSRQMDFPHEVKDNIYFLKTLAVYLLRRMDNDFFDKFINDSGS